ncbi:MAG: type II secretion system protein [Burkholderiales bacterium]|nr:type II secretion system protein [Burkholderiales bacterium]
MKRPADRGFTLVELLITVAIVAVLAMGAMPFMQLVNQRAKEQELRTALRQIRVAIDAYKKAGDEGRILRKADASGYPPSLEVLVEGVDNIKTEGPKRWVFLRRVPRDPFFADRSVEAARTWGRRSYDSPWDSPREGKDVFDVYSLTEGVGLDGTPYREW